MVLAEDRGGEGQRSCHVGDVQHVMSTAQTPLIALLPPAAATTRHLALLTPSTLAAAMSGPSVLIEEP
jgi:hypothetical protein